MPRSSLAVLSVIALALAGCGGQALDTTETPPPQQQAPSAVAPSPSPPTPPPAPPALPTPRLVNLPAGVVLPIRLDHDLNSGVNRTGDPFVHAVPIQQPQRVFRECQYVAFPLPRRVDDLLENRKILVHGRKDLCWIRDAPIDQATLCLDGRNSDDARIRPIRRRDDRSRFSLIGAQLCSNERDNQSR